jgi:hypothetical protein
VWACDGPAMGTELEPALFVSVASAKQNSIDVNENKIMVGCQETNGRFTWMSSTILRQLPIQFHS